MDKLNFPTVIFSDKQQAINKVKERNKLAHAKQGKFNLTGMQQTKNNKWMVASVKDLLIGQVSYM